MKKFKRLIAIVTVLLFALTLVAPAFAQDESTTNPVYDDAAKVLKDKGVMQGNESGDLMLDKSLTRAEVVKMILVATGQEDVAEEYADAEASFSDTAEHWAKKYIEAAKELGIVAGYPDGTFKPEQPVKFEELCKLLVAAANETPAAGKWPLNYVKKALDLGFFNGIEDEVGIGQVVVRGQAAVGFAAAFFPPEKPAPIVKDVQSGDNTSFTVTLEAYAGYTLEDGDVTAADFEVKDAADETKTLAVKDAVLDVAAGKVTVKTDAQVAGKTYKVFFRGQDTTKTFAGAPVELTVADVTADNLKTITVKFNDSLDSTTVNSTNITLTKKSDGSSVTITPNLLSDNKTVVIVASSALEQFATYTVTVNNVKSTQGKTIANFTKEFVVQDLTRPSVADVKVLNPKAIKVFFSEPMNISTNIGAVLQDNLKVDGVNITATIGSVDYVEKSITVTLYNALTAGQHQVEVSGYQDFANFAIAAKQFTINVDADLAAPQIVNVTLDSKTQVTVEFNEPLSEIGNYTVNGQTISLKSFVSGTNNTKVTLTLGTALPVGTTLLIVTYDSQKDLVGNIVSTTQSKTVSISDDTTAPSVKSFTVNSDNSVTVVFTETMKTTGYTIKLYQSGSEVLNPGITTSWSTTTYTNDTVTIRATALNSITTATNYSYVLSGFRDNSIRENIMADYSKEFTAYDRVGPTVANNFLLDTTNKTITFYFNEPMDITTLKNPSLYVYVDGKTRTALDKWVKYSSIAASSDARSVTITLNDATGITGTFEIYGLKDKAGNYLTPYVSPVTNGTAPAFVVNSVYATSTGSILVYTSDKVASVDARAFKLQKDGIDISTFVSASIYADNTNNKYGVVLTPYVSLPANVNPANYTIALNDSYKANVKSIYGVALSGFDSSNTNATKIYDNIKPTATVSSSSGKVYITFDELLTTTTTSDSTYNDVYKDGAVPYADTTIVVFSKTDNAWVNLTGKVTLKNGSSVATLNAGKYEFDSIEISGLTLGNTYTIYIQSGKVTDKALVPNNINAKTVDIIVAQ